MLFLHIGLLATTLLRSTKSTLVWDQELIPLEVTRKIGVPAGEVSMMKPLPKHLKGTSDLHNVSLTANILLYRQLKS